MRKKGILNDYMLDNQLKTRTFPRPQLAGLVAIDQDRFTDTNGDVHVGHDRNLVVWVLSQDKTNDILFKRPATHTFLCNPIHRVTCIYVAVCYSHMEYTGGCYQAIDIYSGVVTAAIICTASIICYGFDLLSWLRSIRRASIFSLKRSGLSSVCIQSLGCPSNRNIPLPGRWARGNSLRYVSD